MARASRPSVAATLLTAVLLTASACGAVDSRTEVLRLKSANPVTADLYVRMGGPAGAVNYIAKGLIRGAFTSYGEGFFVPPNVRRKKACSFSHTIGYSDSPQLQPWRGKTLKITVFGNSVYAATYCRGIQVAGVFQSGA